MASVDPFLQGHVASLKPIKKSCVSSSRPLQAGPVATSSATVRAEPLPPPCSIPAEARLSNATVETASKPAPKRPWDRPPNLYKPRVSKRPSLSEQLKACQENTEGIIQDMKKTFNLDTQQRKEGLILELSSRNFVVGKTNSKYPSTVQFYPDKCTYNFHHIEHNQIQMVMYYGDMTSVAVKKETFIFRIGGSLDYFSKDYDPSNPKHSLEIGFNSLYDTTKFKTQILETIKRQARI